MRKPEFSSPFSHKVTNENQRSNMMLRGNKFVRRHDLSPSIRLYIAFTALMAGTGATWGKITELSRQFMISRMFVYMLANTLHETSLAVFGDNVSKPAVVEDLPYHYILSLRLEGRCSIEAISTLMKRFGIPIASAGSISQYLQYVGFLLPNTVTTSNDEVKLVVFLSDEIFAKNIPILVTVDPISSAILKIELADSRKVEDWKNHWECLEKNGYIATYLVTDEGRGLCSAQKEALADIIRQPDTYHAIAHQLGKWVNILEAAAYKAIQKEFDCYNKLNSARSNEVINKRIDEHEEAVKNADEAIELYESFHFLYVTIINELKLFDVNGNLRDRKEAEDNIEASLSLIEELEHTKITKAVNKVRRTMPGLLNYFDVAKAVVGNLSNLPIDQEILQVLCLAWQWRKGLIKSKKAKGQKYCGMNEQDCLEIVMDYLQKDYAIVKEQVYKQLDQIVQSSALVECINSIIRPYLNGSKNHVTQATLNLIMFYHNHRRYKDGKRKNQTPMEILTGKKQKKDWIALLFEVVKEKDPSFFASTQ
jgi:hypothetical protein